MADTASIETVPASGGATRWLHMLWRDKFATLAVLVIALLAIIVIVGPPFLGEYATKVALRQRNMPPGSLDAGWLYVLGADNLGRSIVARLVVGAQNTLGVALAATALALVVGGLLGLIAGYAGGWIGNLIMRAADIVMSFPSLLLALVVLFLLGQGLTNLVLVLAITRIPIYLRTTRAEVLEIRERMFVSASKAMGAPSLLIVWRHIVPIVAPTLITIAAVDFATVILAESALSFLGLGIQPPAFTWGAMVADARSYLSTAWWLALWPGLAIMVTTLSFNLLSSWLRLANDPQQQWRLFIERGARK